jgi:hypothetical protein
MEHCGSDIRIEAPIEHVWAFYCDTSHWPDWMPGGTLSDISGPYDQVGTTYHAIARLLGHEMKVTYKVIEVEPLSSSTSTPTTARSTTSCGSSPTARRRG